ncbi:3D domain-containing protein [Clostridium sp. DJ247]|uniref:3D domain-containing protein n=1 Tax=Clostridium sp. DJ247 TaxID=2726188 RepID=UPI001F4D1090|nr:3D domain-containing protein [Clostridium sp. DJ247]MBC2581104.1 hypothetical protein [Clostridium sp. DJ247]
MNKKTLPVIMMLALTVIIHSNVFAASSTITSDSFKQTQGEEKELQAKVQELDKQIDEVINKIDSNKKDMNKIAEDIKNTQVKLDAIENTTKAQEDLFKERVRAIYINGGHSYLNVILTSNSLSNFISRLDMVTKVLEFDNQIIIKLKEERQTIANQKEALICEKNKLEALKKSNESNLSKLNKNVSEQRKLLSKVTGKDLLANETANTSGQLTFNDSTGFNDGTLSRGKSISSSYSQVLNMEATAYSGDGITASGTATRRDSSGYSTIAVDPRVIPLGSKVYVEGYGYAIAADTGGAIKGNIIDVFFQSDSEARNWGRTQVKVYILD